LLLTACGGGGGDINPIAPPEQTPGLSDPNRFLLFPNPQAQADGSFQTNTVAYPEAYYRAIDPTNAKDTLAKWRAVNGFDSGTGTQVTVVFGDRRDLGYGRRMTARQNVDGTVAVMVENFLVEPAVSYAYSTVNLDAAVNEDRRWHLGTNAIEFSPGPAGGLAFTKFFTFNPTTGARENTINMDGRGEKAMPGPCITCHGGRGDALTPPDGTGNPRFPLIANSPTGSRGDVLARMHPLELDVMDFSANAAFTRAAQEASIKTINRMILCTYPIPAPSGFPEDACRRVAAANEWQGSGAALIKNAYGGDGLPNAVYNDTLVPAGWGTVGQTSLYRDVVAQYCRACHIMRGTASQSDLDFDSFAKFQGFADRVKAHVIDRGNMPLARIVYDAFIANTGAVNQLATFLENQGFVVRDSAGNVLRAGRPIADPGPDRVVRQGAITLSAANSLFANGFEWSIVSGPGGATLTNPNGVQPTFTTIADGTYVLQLIALADGVAGAPVQVRIVVNNALAPAPSAIRFADIKNVLQTAGCTTACHIPGGTGGPPIVYSNIDRNGDGIIGDATDDQWFHAEVRGRVNFTDIAASPILRKPSGNHHNGLVQPGFDVTALPGQAARANYDLFLNWILNGAPQ
jgi:mono/diheme cytochrome c family protein